ncbi:hypothetical protein Nwat_2717 [Nitrosococcus watsonii C-113]|uniref:Uncharacterized protein n=2 Tax=Nitrosococcus TaxID=1227 RepID=D8KAQ6_NITWC|nr:hypothetical protein Nwat_2717 [Nitrosococcus watsonii C-113]
MEGLLIAPASLLSDWRVICLQWIAELTRFSEIMDYEDAVHEQLERTNSGMLGIAAAKCGYGVLLEAYVSRGKKGGYLDICFFDPSRDKSILVECKWIQGDSRSLIRSAKSSLDEALEQVSAVENPPIATKKRYQNIEKVGVIFACPFFQSNLDLENIKAGLLEILGDCQKNPFYDAMAWCFSDRLSTTVRRYQGVYPGIIMLCKEFESSTVA